VLLADMDTLRAIEVVESYVGRVRVQQPQRVDRFVALLTEHFDFAAIYKNLGLHAK
jgi:BioD-like phosphotransacetylase family protein